MAERESCKTIETYYTVCIPKALIFWYHFLTAFLNLYFDFGTVPTMT